jgi:hypothetical protein
METDRGETVCLFCKDESSFIGSELPEANPYASVDDSVSSILREYADNAEKTSPHAEERPAQIVIEEDDVNDTLKLNTFVRDILDVGIKRFQNGSPEYLMMDGLYNSMNDFTDMIVEKAKRFEVARKHKTRMAPILFSKMESQSLYRILDMVEKMYGKFVRNWFLTKAKKDWPAWRKIFYEGAWNLGSFVRHGRPAKNPSPWLLGTRQPLDEDPLAKYPLGQEPKWSPGLW